MAKPVYVWATHNETKWGDEGIELFATEVDAYKAASWIWENDPIASELTALIDKAANDQKAFERFRQLFDEVLGESSHRFYIVQVPLPMDLLALNLEAKFGGD